MAAHAEAASRTSTEPKTVPMRLLDVHIYTLENTWEHPPGTDWRYAILSHKREAGEVLLHHMQDGTVASSMAGFEKVLGTCRQARKDKFRYAWLDTVCIDKESSAELSEAINSVYKWYQAADVCYVYLSDVSSPEEISNSIW